MTNNRLESKSVPGECEEERKMVGNQDQGSRQWVVIGPTDHCENLGFSSECDGEPLQGFILRRDLWI